jgi:hypothetical protein
MQINTRKLEQQEWGSYFDAISKRLEASTVDVIVLGLDYGAQTEVRRLPLIGISYDGQANALDIITEPLGHRIDGPTEIYVLEDAMGRLVCCEVKDEDDHKQILQLDPSLLLKATS